jgi:hypothetical protein
MVLSFGGYAMGNIKTIYCGNGYEIDATYALMGVNEQGEVVNEEKFKDFWKRLNKALAKRDKELNDDTV